MGEGGLDVVWPHAEGVNHISYTPDGRYLHTSGNEGFLRIFHEDPTLEPRARHEPKLIEYHESAITGLSASSTYICSAGEAGEVALHEIGSTTLFSLLTRCSFSVRCVRFDPKGRRLAVASDELIVKVVDVANPLKVQLLTGHRKSVRAVSWSPDGSIITTSSTDGEIRVWDLAGSEASCIKVIEGVIPETEPESDISVEAKWHPSGKSFVVPNRTGKIALISKDEWAVQGTFSNSGEHSAPISAMTWSSNGLYLASADATGKVLIWKTLDRSLLNKMVPNPEDISGTVTSIEFQPGSLEVNMLTWITSQGQLARWSSPVPAGIFGPNSTSSSALESTESISKKIGDSAYRRSRGDSTAGLQGGTDGAPAVSMSDIGDGDDWIDDDLEAGLPYGIEEHGHEDAYLEYGGRSLPGRSLLDPARSPKIKGQASFQVGSTPMKSGKRYLAFNMLGMIHVVERDDINIITIDFHDKSSHLGTHFNDTHKFHLASLGELGSVFACGSLEESPSMVYYRPYESWSNVESWTYSLPAGEEAVIVAVGGMAEPLGMDSVGIAGSGTVLIATNKGYVRFLSGSGLQKYLWNFGEEIVTMVAGKDWAVIVYRGGSVIDGNQNLEYVLVDTDTFEVVQQGRLPLSKESTLKWIGFSDDQIPVMYDSNGLLSILDRSRRPRQARWVPALDTNQLARREGKSESYWPIGVTEQHVHVIILKGSEQYPGFPTPLFQEVDLQLPLLRLDGQQGQLEEQYLRDSMLIAQRRDGTSPDDYNLMAKLNRQEVEVDKHLLKIIQTSCKAEKLQAALDAALLLSQPASLAAAAKISLFFNLPSLHERIVLVQEAKSGVRALEDDNKRGGKWAHLIDDRTIVQAPTRHAHGRQGNLFSGGSRLPESNPKGPFTLTSSHPPSNQISITPASTSRSMAKVDSGFGEQEDEYHTKDNEGQMNEDDGSGEDEEDEEAARYSKRQKSLSDEDAMEEDEQDSMAPPPPKKAHNPFAKRKVTTEVTQPHSSPNPFAAKQKSNASDLQRTGSFFNRIEGKEGPKEKSGKARGRGSEHSLASAPKSNKIPMTGTRQTTLFGLAPSIPAAKIGKEKSRAQPTEAASKENAVWGKTFDQHKSEDSMSKAASEKIVKELPREGDDFEESQVTEESLVDEPVDFTQRHDENEVLAVEGGKDTQAAQRDSDDSPSPAKVDSTPSVGDGISKLSRFLNKSSTVPSAVVTLSPEVLQDQSDLSINNQQAVVVEPLQ